MVRRADDSPNGEQARQSRARRTAGGLGLEPRQTDPESVVLPITPSPNKDIKIYSLGRFLQCCGLADITLARL